MLLFNVGSEDLSGSSRCTIRIPGIRRGERFAIYQNLWSCDLHTALHGTFRIALMSSWAKKWANSQWHAGGLEAPRATSSFREDERNMSHAGSRHGCEQSPHYLEGNLPACCSGVASLQPKLRSRYSYLALLTCVHHPSIGLSALRVASPPVQVPSRLPAMI